jgi:hypothetical protein
MMWFYPSVEPRDGKRTSWRISAVSEVSEIALKTPSAPKILLKRSLPIRQISSVFYLFSQLRPSHFTTA